jgi:hypothetical protein
MVKEELEDKFVFNLGILDNFSINIFKFLINLVKIMIFFELGFSSYFMIVCIKEQYGLGPWNLFRIIYDFLWTGFMVFINCFYELIYQLLSLNIGLIIFYLSIFLIGYFIWYLVEINPSISNYFIGSLVYGFLIYFQIYYLSKYFNFEP